MTTRTVADLRKSIASMPEADRWVLAPNINDKDLLKARKTGGDLTQVPLASTIKALDFHTILALDVDVKTILGTKKLTFPGPLEVSGFKPVAVPDVAPAPAAPPAPTTGAAPTRAADPAAPPPSIDWRTRYGGGWLQPIQDQDGDPSCWAFASAALVETMVRISHNVWSKRSEGDVRDGWGGAFGEDWAARDLVAPAEHGVGGTGSSRTACATLIAIRGISRTTTMTLPAIAVVVR
jgi:hypothetical protein